jgi:hypothetical protein
VAVLSGLLTESAYGGIKNPLLTPDFSAFSFNWWPSSASTVRDVPIDVLVAHWPVEANGREIFGFEAISYSDDFYHRIHITPSRLDLGNIVSTQTAAISVWNAYLAPVQLTEITGLADGIELTGQPDPQLNFNALQERIWSVAVTPDGPAVLDSALEWIFGNGDVAALVLTGNRIQAFTFIPSWENGIDERLVWATDILQSNTGAEQCRALRLSPRREFEIDVPVQGCERQAFDMALFGWSARVWAIPVWPDIQQLDAPVAAGAFEIPCDTAHRDFRANGLGVLRSERIDSIFNFETVEIDSVAPGALTLKRALIKDWPAGTRLYPARTARMASAPEVSRKTDQMQTARIQFNVVESCEWPAIMPVVTYRGYPVLDTLPDESQDLTSHYQHLLLTLDNGSAAPKVTDTAGLAFPVNQYRWSHYGRAQRAAYRSLLYALRGRQARIWVCTHADDLTVIATIAESSSVIEIVNIGYARYSNGKTGRRDIRVQLHNGTVYRRRITGAAEVSADVEHLTVDAAFGVQIAPADIARISWMYLARQDSDALMIKHENDSDGLATSQQIFRGVRDEL